MLENGYDIDIREIPSIIGGDQESRHGIVLAKSVPAKAYGIVTGEPIVNAKRKCPNLAVYPSESFSTKENIKNALATNTSKHALTNAINICLSYFVMLFIFLTV